MRRTLYGLTLALACCVGPVWGAAEERPLGYLEGSTRKLGRGACNIMTGPLEMIRTPSLVTQQEGGLAGATVGVIQGVGAAITRELAGVLEVATFFLPFPNRFNPIMKPEFVYAHGDWVP